MDLNHSPALPVELIEQVRAARWITVLTGAGISAESGVPTFRDALTGLWARYQPEELATSEAFQRDPQLVWEWYAWRRRLVGEVQPNPGHYALAEMERNARRYTLITQNVDGLHHRAGSQAVLELHGNLQRVKCFTEGVIVEDWHETPPDLPRCPHCGDYLRPDVVWFGEMLPAGAFDAAYEAAMGCDLFFTIGTSGLVQPAASLPWYALENGAVIVEVNPNPTPFTRRATYHLEGPSGVILPLLVKAVWGSRDQDGDV